MTAAHGMAPEALPLGQGVEVEGSGISDPDPDP